MRRVPQVSAIHVFLSNSAEPFGIAKAKAKMRQEGQY